MNFNDTEEAEQMRSALSAIADEVQKFHNESSNEANDKILSNEDMLSAALVQCKCTLKLKREQIRILKQHLKTACIVAKSLAGAKERETTSLSNQLNKTRSEYWDLVEQEKEKNKLLHILQTDNETIRDKLQYLNSFIQLGYQGLQNVQNEKTENISSLKQLQRIIYFCGQYYANYCDQSERCRQLEQKNRFLNSKLRILEGHLEVTSNELRNLCVNGKREEFGIRQFSSSKQKHNICAVCSESQICNHRPVNFTETHLEKTKQSNNNKNVDLTSHLNTIKNLLRDQDILLKDLKSLSKEISVESLVE